MSFDRLAPHYRWLECVLAGRVLQRARLAHVHVLDRAERVLLVGEGPGRFLAALRARRADVSITVVDASEAMLREAARHVGWDVSRWPQGSKGVLEAAGVRFIVADVRAWEPPRAAFDAIVTCCVLDCFTAATLEMLIPRLASGIAARGDWINVDFAVPARGWRRTRARLVHALMYATFVRATGIEARALTPPDSWIRAAGFDRVSVRAFSAGLIRSEHWQRRSG